MERTPVARQNCSFSSDLNLLLNGQNKGYSLKISREALTTTKKLNNEMQNPKVSIESNLFQKIQ